MHLICVDVLPVFSIKMLTLNLKLIMYFGFDVGLTHLN